MLAMKLLILTVTLLCGICICAGFPKKGVSVLYANGYKFFCDFSESDCGLMNDEITGTKFHRFYGQLGNYMGYYMAVDSRRSSDNFARLITPYFELDEGAVERQGCLRINIYRAGKGIPGFRITQQNHANTLIVRNEYAVAAAWENFALDVDLSQGGVRFFIDVRLDRGEPEGIFAINQIAFISGPCHSRQ